MKQDKHHETQGAPGAPVVLPDAYYDDEISLIDLWCVLVKRKNIIFLCLGLAVALGIAYALLKPVLYSYTTVIEVGSLGNKQGPVEPIKDLQAKLEKVYIPAALMNESEGSRVDIKVSTPKDASNLLVLESDTQENRRSIVTKLHGALSERIIQEHKAQFRSYRSNLDADYEKYSSLLADVHKQTMSVAAQNQPGNESLILASMNMNYQSDLEDKLSSIKTQLLTMKESTVLDTAMRSQFPVGTGRKVIILVTAMFGLLLGIFMAFFVEFLQKVKASQAT